MRRTETVAARGTIRARLMETGKQIDVPEGRIMDASSPSVIGTHEKRIDAQERQRIRLAEQADSAAPPQGRLSEFIEPDFALLASS